MTLPKRNLALRVIYSLSMVGMFVFLGWQALAYDSAPPTAAISTGNTAPLSVAQSPVVDKQPQPMIHQQQALAVHGLSSVLNLDDDLDSQINQLWLRFAYSSLAEQLPDNAEVYAVYTDYDRQSNQLKLTLGLTSGTGAETQSSIAIAPGDYLSVADKTVLAFWQQPGTRAHKQRFLSDYEIWTLDGQLQPVKVTAFIGIK